MLVKSGDLIPVKHAALHIPYVKRKSQVLNYLHRGEVTFETLVYDTNVGDIAPISSYFNPERWTVFDLNHKFGAQTQGSGEGSLCASSPDTTSTNSISETFDPKLNGIKPRLLIYPEKSTSPAPSPSSTSTSGAGEAERRIDNPVQKTVQPVTPPTAENAMEVFYPPVELFTTLRLVFDEEVPDLTMAPWFSSIPLNTVCYADKDPMENLLWW